MKTVYNVGQIVCSPYGYAMIQSLRDSSPQLGKRPCAFIAVMDSELNVETFCVLQSLLRPLTIRECGLTRSVKPVARERK